ncbi:MAG: hypothetical protein DBX55_07490 [Verrucomicrobia bacterium]|nr:MAG: hypothetical protein DBX55_07490 [Verrucomicrobiota bacterium]
MDSANYKIFVINLDSRKDRLARITDNLNRLGVEFDRFQAVFMERDRNSPRILNAPLKFNSAKNRLFDFNPISPGALGCYYSHMLVWKKILDEKLDFAVILEDDADLGENFPDAVNLLGRLKNWDYIKIPPSHLALKVSKSAPVPLRHASSASPAAEFRLCAWRKVPFLTTVECVSFQGAKKLLSVGEFYRPIDFDLQFYWRFGVKIFGLLGENIVSVAQSKSDISTTADPGAKSNVFVKLYMKPYMYLANLAYRALWRNSLREIEIA